jgi:hypothetical protein
MALPSGSATDSTTSWDMTRVVVARLPEPTAQAISPSYARPWVGVTDWAKTVIHYVGWVANFSY